VNGRGVSSSAAAGLFYREPGHAVSPLVFLLPSWTSTRGTRIISTKNK